MKPKAECPGGEPDKNIGSEENKLDIVKTIKDCQEVCSGYYERADSLKENTEELFADNPIEKVAGFVRELRLLGLLLQSNPEGNDVYLLKRYLSTPFVNFAGEDVVPNILKITKSIEEHIKEAGITI